MCNKAVHAFLPILKFIRDWFVTNKILKKFDDVFSNDNIDLDDIDSDGIGLNILDLNIDRLIAV